MEGWKTGRMEDNPPFFHSSTLPIFQSFIPCRNSRNLLYCQHKMSAGTYVIVLWLHTPQRVRVGRLAGGMAGLWFPAGYYLYMGSAHGPGGLAARLARHGRRLGPGKRPHWHIDFLRERATFVGAWGREAHSQCERIECDWASAARRLPDADVVAARFGASDCRCPAHLVRVPACPPDEWFRTELGAERMDVDGDSLDTYLLALITGDDQAREAAALALGREGQAAIEPLAELLAAEQPGVSWWAARALSEVGGEQVVAPLLRALDDTDPDVRACAALALGHTSSAGAAAGLAARLADESAFVAAIAADALSMIGSPAVPALIDMLQAEDARTRLLAVRALARVKDPAAIGPIFKLLDDPSYMVRFYADEALEAMGVGMVYLAP